MKTKKLIALAVLLLTAVTMTAAAAEDRQAVLTPCDEWSWDPGAYNTFDGEIDLSGYEGQEITVTVDSDLIYDEEKEKDSIPVFMTLNGKRFTMNKQKKTIRCTPDAENPVMRFSAKLKMPGRQHVNGVTFTFTLADGNGNTLEAVSGTIGSGEAADETAVGAFFIRTDILLITCVTAGAAGLVWAAALARNRRISKKERNGD